jgi:hypothetical protein
MDDLDNIQYFKIIDIFQNGVLVASKFVSLEGWMDQVDQDAEATERCIRFCSDHGFSFDDGFEWEWAL